MSCFLYFHFIFYSFLRKHRFYAAFSDYRLLSVSLWGKTQKYIEDKLSCYVRDEQDLISSLNMRKSDRGNISSLPHYIFFRSVLGSLSIILSLISLLYSLALLIQNKKKYLKWSLNLTFVRIRLCTSSSNAPLCYRSLSRSIIYIQRPQSYRTKFVLNDEMKILSALLFFWICGEWFIKNRRHH